MACAPCQQKALARQRALAESKVRTSAYTKSNQRTANVGCNNMYDTLSVLDSDIVRIYKKKGALGNGIGSEVLKKQRLLRRWMSELSLHCPPEGELDQLRQWVALNLG